MPCMQSKVSNGGGNGGARPAMPKPRGAKVSPPPAIIICQVYQLSGLWLTSKGKGGEITGEEGQGKGRGAKGSKREGKVAPPNWLTFQCVGLKCIVKCFQPSTR